MTSNGSIDLLPGLLTCAAAVTPAAQRNNGQVEPTWDSMQRNCLVPPWFTDGKFGIFIHWGVFAVPAHVSESYCKQMYGSNREITPWHAENYSDREVRFTTRGAVLYAIVLDWPEREAIIRSLGWDSPAAGRIKDIHLLGHTSPLVFTQAPDELRVRLPARRPCDHAFALRISRFP